MHTRAKQYGFSVIEIVLVAVIVGILAFVGVRVYQAQQEVASVQEKTTATGTVEKKAGPSDTPAVQKAEDLNALERSVDSTNIEGDSTTELDSELNF